MVKKSHGEVIKILIMKDVVAKLHHIEFVFSLMCLQQCMCSNVLYMLYILHILYILSIIMCSSSHLHNLHNHFNHLLIMSRCSPSDRSAVSPPSSGTSIS